MGEIWIRYSHRRSTGRFVSWSFTFRPALADLFVHRGCVVGKPEVENEIRRYRRVPTGALPTSD